MSENTDWALVERACAGDMWAFEDLVIKYQGAIVSFCHRMVGSQQEAEDIAQECFIRLYRALPRLRPKAKFSTFLFGIARNLSLNEIRNSKRRGRDKAVSLTQDDFSEYSIEDKRLGTERVLRLQEIEDALEKAISQLSPEFREVLLLREFQGMDYETIAGILKCRKGTLKSRLARAREQLRVKIVKLGGDML